MSANAIVRARYDGPDRIGRFSHLADRSPSQKSGLSVLAQGDQLRRGHSAGRIYGNVGGVWGGALSGCPTRVCTVPTHQGAYSTTICPAVSMLCRSAATRLTPVSVATLVML